MRGTRRLVAGLLATGLLFAGLVAAAGATGTIASARIPTAASKTCPSGYVLASLSWGEKCLHAGEFCKVGNLEYHVYGFDCPADGRLTYRRPATATTTTPGPPASAPFVRISHVADGDTVTLTDGLRVRFVQIDTPEVYFDVECFGPQASAETKRLLPPGTAVRLLREPATDAVDQYGRLLRYVIRASDGLNVNLRLVADGAAAPYFYAGRRGMFADRLERLARNARARHLGLWGRCPRTPYQPDHSVSTRR